MLRPDAIKVEENIGYSLTEIRAIFSWIYLLMETKNKSKRMGPN